MTNQEKMTHLESLLDIEPNTLNEDTELTDISQWDSMAVIAVIAMFDSDFGRIVTADDVKKFITVKDITDLME